MTFTNNEFLKLEYIVNEHLAFKSGIHFEGSDLEKLKGLMDRCRAAEAFADSVDHENPLGDDRLYELWKKSKGEK